jgi:1-acyl-sn-glycerol-3-phosphate acyltransferase
VRALLRFLLEALVRLYFPAIRIEGRARVPPQGPVVFVLNHPNGLLDPMVLRLALGRPVRFLAKSTLFNNPLGRLTMSAFGAIPVYRRRDVGKGGGDPSMNERTFARCRAALGRGEWLALFPEGVSHPDAQLKPLKTGAARIALSAERAHARPLGLTIVPVGLAYDDPAEFRSRALAVVGEPLRAADFQAQYAADEEAAVDALTAAIRAGLEKVVLQAETRDLLDGVARVAVWTADDAAIRDDHVEQNRRAHALLDAYAALRRTDPPRVDAVVAAARRYARTLSALGVTDPWALEVGRVRLGAALRVAAKLLGLFVPAVVGAVLGWVPYRLAGWAARRLAPSEDIRGTVKVLGGALFLVVAWALEAVAAGVFTRAGGWAALALVAGPACGYAALRFDETRALAAEGLRHLWLRAARPETAHALADRRRARAPPRGRAQQEE